MTKKTVGIMLAVMAVLLMCPLLGLLYVGYDKMMVHNLGRAAEEEGTVALLGSGCCCSVIAVMLIGGLVLMMAKPKQPNG